MKIKIRLRPISAQKYLEINEKEYINRNLSNLNKRIYKPKFI